MTNHHNARPSVQAFLTNLQVPMPLWKKIWLLGRNNAKKILTMRNCCGNHGQPGC
jgi:hypothetical protein